jgi:hypothetical protein
MLPGAVAKAAAPGFIFLDESGEREYDSIELQIKG